MSKVKRREMLKELLLDYLDNGNNDYDENIMNIEIGKDEICIQTEFSVELEIPVESKKTIQASRASQLNFIINELEEDHFFDSIEFNYVTGFYSTHFEGLDVYDFVNKCDYYCVDGEYIRINFDMEYSMNIKELEIIFRDYKKCA